MVDSPRWFSVSGVFSSQLQFYIWCLNAVESSNHHHKFYDTVDFLAIDVCAFFINTLWLEFEIEIYEVVQHSSSTRLCLFHSCAQA